MIGHANENVTRATAKYLGYRTMNKNYICKPCALAKASRTPIIRQVGHFNEVGERFGIDISGISTISYGGYRYWQLKICYGSNFIWSSFLRKKADGTEDLVPFVKQRQLTDIDYKVSFI